MGSHGTAPSLPLAGYGPRYEDVNRRAIELRYELLPHIYNVMQQASETGVPAFRPLLLEYPDDPATWERDDEFLFGSDLLVAPVLREGAGDREVYLPAGDWYDYYRGWRFEGRRTHLVPVTMEAIPVFVRGGAFLFRQPVVQHTGEMSGQPLTVDVYPADQSKATLYEDDGLSVRYQNGAYFEHVPLFGELKILETEGKQAGRFGPANPAVGVRRLLDWPSSRVQLCPGH